jgi:APA family basic amino acid/polyamine antiporter
VPAAAVLVSFYLMLNLPTATWVRFGIWMVIGLVLYATYGSRRSKLSADSPYPDGTSAASTSARSGTSPT